MVQEFTGIPSSPLVSPKLTTSNYYPFRPLAQQPLLYAQSYSLLNDNNLPFQPVVQQQLETISSLSGNNTDAILAAYNPGTPLQELSGILGNDQLFMCSNDVNMCSSAAFRVPHMVGAWCDRSLVSSNDDLNGVGIGVAGGHGTPAADNRWSRDTGKHESTDYR